MKNELKINKGDAVPTIPSYEVAEMMERRHSDVLRMLEGSEKPKVVGIIPTILTSVELRLLDYFIESTYVDKKGESRKYYECTKMGCELLANKMTGEKGILFTARYTKRYNEMEKALKERENPLEYKQLSLKEQLQLKLFSNDSMEVVNAHKELVKIEVQEATTPLLNKIEEDKPLVKFAETISQASDSIDIGTFSKLVKDQDIKIGRNKLFEWLRDNGYLMKNNVPYQKYIDNNYFEIVEYTYKTSYGEKLTTKTLITGLGQVKIIEKLRKELNN